MANQADFAKAVSLYDDKHYLDAMNAFLSLSSDSAFDNDARYYIGLCCFSLQRFDDAMTYLEQVVGDSSLSGGQSKTEEQKAGGGQAGAASKEKTPSPSMQDRILQCRLILFIIYAVTGRHSLAEFEMQKLLDAGYKKNNVYCTAAFMAYEERDADTAINYYERALEADPNCVTALNGLGYVLSQEGRDLTRALDCCTRAVAVMGSAANLDSLGCVYAKLGMKAKAKEYLKQAMDLCNASQKEIIQGHLDECGND